MVSPLQTWQHHEPKGLWAGLGSLAVVAHMGILGFSLPYLLDIAQPSGEGFNAIAPIELIEVDAETSFEPTETPPQNSQSPTTAAPSERPETETAANDVNRPSAITSTSDSTSAIAPATGSTTGSPPTPRPSTPGNTSPNNGQGSSRSQGAAPQTPSEPGSGDSESEGNETEGNETEGNESEGNETEGNETEGNESEGNETEGNETEEPGSPAAPGAQEDPSGSTSPPESSGEPSSSPPESEVSPPVIPGETSLPEPGNTPGSGASDNQQTYLSVTSHGYVPEALQRDLVDTPPELIYGSKTSLEANPLDLGCGRVDFSQTQVTYRVTIGADGALLSAIPWTNSIEAQPMSSSERAISCLLESAGFSFTPALQDGSPVANSNLLLTIEIIESGVN
ncbi:MAG: hypothetical protein AAFR58_04450 [Cyanobacteria bacterium J06627_28]